MKLQMRYLLVALLGGAVLAGAPQVFSQEEGSRRTSEVRRISAVMGASVALKDADRMGKVEDFVVNDDGCIDYLVVGYEAKYVLIPWSVATVSFDRNVVRVDVTRETFLGVPTFTKDHWSEVSSGRYLERVRHAFGATSDRRGRHTEGTTERRGGERGTTEDSRGTERGTTEERRGTERRNGREGNREPTTPERPSTTPARPGPTPERPTATPPDRTLRPGEPARPSAEPARGREPAQRDIPKGPAQDR